MKTALVIRHVPYEGVAGFRAPVEAAGYAVDRVDVTDPAFPDMDFLRPDLVIMMGGPMGVYEQEAHPWIVHEIERLAERIDAGRPTLGVCLGAQMIAAAMGARVYPGPVKEVGFAPLRFSQAALGSPLVHLYGVDLLHWHGDTFDLPHRAELLASTDAYAQIFRRGRNILALQCHAEMGEDPRFGAWIAGGGAFLAQAGIVPDALRAQHDRLGTAAVEAGRRMIADWLAQLDV